MAKTLLLSGDSPGANQTSTVNTTQFWFNCGAAVFVNATETNTQSIFRTAGKLSNLWVCITTNSTTITITSRKNAAAGGQSISVGASATGNFTDAVNSDTIAAGDKVSIRSVPGAAGTFIMTLNSFTYAATTNTAQRLVSFANLGYLTASVTNFMLVNGHNDTILTTEPTEKIRQRKGGTFKNGAVNLSANTRTTAGTVNSRKNGGNGTISISVTASTAGFFEDTTHSDTVVAGDDYCFSFVTGSGTGTSTVQTAQVDLTNSSGDGELVVSLNGTNNPGTNVTVFSTCGGSFDTSATEANMQAVVNFPYVFSNLNINVSSNGSAGAQTVTFRKTAADTALTISISAAVTGQLTDATDAVTTLSTDSISHKFVLGSAGMGISYISVWTNLQGASFSRNFDLTGYIPTQRDIAGLLGAGRAPIFG